MNITRRSLNMISIDYTVLLHQGDQKLRDHAEAKRLLGVSFWGAPAAKGTGPLSVTPKAETVDNLKFLNSSIGPNTL